MAKVTFILSVICIVTKHNMAEDTDSPKLFDLNFPILDGLIASQKQQLEESQAGTVQPAIDLDPPASLNAKEQGPGSFSPSTLGDHQSLNLLNNQYRPNYNHSDSNRLDRPESTVKRLPQINNINQEISDQFESDHNQALGTSQENRDADLADITSLHLQSSNVADKDTHSFTPVSTRTPIVDGDAKNSGAVAGTQNQRNGETGDFNTMIRKEETQDQVKTAPVDNDLPQMDNQPDSNVNEGGSQHVLNSADSQKREQVMGGKEFPLEGDKLGSDDMIQRNKDVPQQPETLGGLHSDVLSKSPYNVDLEVQNPFADLVSQIKQREMETPHDKTQESSDSNSHQHTMEGSYLGEKKEVGADQNRNNDSGSVQQQFEVKASYQSNNQQMQLQQQSQYEQKPEQSQPQSQYEQKSQQSQTQSHYEQQPQQHSQYEQKSQQSQTRSQYEQQPQQHSQYEQQPQQSQLQSQYEQQSQQPQQQSQSEQPQQQSQYEQPQQPPQQSQYEQPQQQSQYEQPQQPPQQSQYEQPQQQSQYEQPQQPPQQSQYEQPQQQSQYEQPRQPQQQSQYEQQTQEPQQQSHYEQQPQEPQYEQEQKYEQQNEQGTQTEQQPQQNEQQQKLLDGEQQQQQPPYEQQSQTEDDVGEENEPNKTGQSLENLYDDDEDNGGGASDDSDKYDNDAYLGDDEDTNYEEHPHDNHGNVEEGQGNDNDQLDEGDAEDENEEASETLTDFSTTTLSPVETAGNWDWENDGDKDAEEDEWFNNFGDEEGMDEENNDDSREMDGNDDEDDDYDFSRWNNADDDDADWDENNDDFAETQNNFVEGVVDEELARKNKQPTAPTSMVLFYTWMIVAILIVVVGVSTYRAHCKGMLFGRRTSANGEDRKRLLEHEFV